MLSRVAIFSHSLAGWRLTGLERQVGGSVRLPAPRAGLPGRAAQEEGGVSDSWRDPEGGRAPRAGAGPEGQVRCGSGTEEVRDGGTGWPGVWSSSATHIVRPDKRFLFLILSFLFCTLGARN